VVAAGILGVVVAPVAPPASAASGDSTITISKQTLRGSSSKIVGTTFELRPYTAGQTQPPAHAGGEPSCTIASGTSCQVVVASTGSGQANNNKRYWVVETNAPAGTTAIAKLGTGDASAVVRANPYPGLTPQLNSSSVNMPVDGYQLVADNANSTSVEQSNAGSVVVNRLDDPALNVPCNTDLDIALVLDKSSSINGGGTDYRASYATGVGQLLDALGASSHTKVAAFTFNTNAAKLVGLDTPSANKSTIVNNITGNSYAAATNWDAGFQAVSGDADLSKYDVVMMVTDGAPNTYGNNVSAGGVEFRAMEEAVLSANALKNAGKQVIAVGVGAINNKPTEGKLNLAAISDESHDYIGDWADLGTQLANIAKELTCQGTVTVTKTTVNGATTTPNATGWAFTAANTGGKGSTSDSSTQTTTAPKPSASWTYQFNAKADTTTVNVKETNQSGWQQTGIVCDGKSVPAKADGSFDLPVTSGTNTSCTVTNTFALGDLVITKKDATTGNTVTVAGTEFDVKQGATVVKHVVDNGANDADGTVGVIKVTNLPTGDYTVVETKAPTGYWLPAATSKDVSVTTGGGSLTFSDPRQWAALTATKAAQGDYDTLYHWSIGKGVRVGASGGYTGNATQGSSTGSGSFNYQVQVTEGARDVSNVKVTGKISVTNTNALPVTADLTDSFGGAGWSCTVNGGTTTVAVPANKTTDYTYSCTGPNTLPADGTNTATVSWSKANYPQAQADVGAGGNYSTSPQAAVTFTEHATNKTVTLSDDKFSGAPISGPTLPASITWQSQGHQTTVLYSRTLTANAGTCTSDTNTATIKAGAATLGSASATAKLCTGADLVVTKNAVGSITRSYLWKIDKRPCGPAILQAVCDLTPTTFTVGDDGTVTVPYTVEAVPNGSTEIGWLMTGEITVTNNNDWEDVTLTGVTDAYPGASNCTVDTSNGLAVPRNGGKKVYPYTCTFTSQPSKTATNTATATWDKTTASTPSGSADGTRTLNVGDWTVDDTQAVNKTIKVYDDKTDPAHPVLLGQATWNDAGTPTQFDYTLNIDGVAGECVQPTNTAFLAQAADGQRIAQDDVTVTVCAPNGLTLSKTAAGTFDRTYHWTLAKQVKDDKGQWVDQATQTVSSYTAPFDYRVVLTQDGFDDGNWKITGDITVTNTNDASVTDPVSTTLTDTPDVGGALTGCTNTDDHTAINGTVVTLASGASKTIHYQCTFSAEPDYTGGSNTVSGTNATSGSHDVTFTVDKRIDDHATVYDNKVTSSANGGKGVVLGTATYDEGDPGKASTWTYTNSDLQADPAKECTDFVNTAKVYGDDSVGTLAPDAHATATICPVPGTWKVTKTSDVTDGPVPVDSDITYTLTATKTGGVNPKNVVIEDDLGPLASVVSLPTQDELDAAAPAGTAAALDGTVVRWTIAELSGSAALDITVHVHPTAYGVDLPNLVTSTGSDNCDPRDEGFPADECTTDNKTPHYTLRKSSDGGPQVLPPYLGQQGTLITYTLTVHNDSDAPINATTMPGEQVTDDLTDVLDNATWVGNLTPAGQAERVGNTLTWTLPEIPVGGTATLTYQVRVAADQWDEALTNVASPGSGGDCVAPLAIVLVVANPNCTTTSVTPPYAQVRVLKVDDETGAPLAGAHFTLSQGEDVLETGVSGEDGTVTFATKLQPGSFTVTETQAPAGYSLPADTTQPVTVTEDDLDNGVEPVVVTFGDPPTGSLAITKGHRELVGGSWVPGDGTIAFNDRVKYVLTVSATGPRVFHDVTVTDYVPGYNPADTQTQLGGLKGVLDIGSITCSGAVTCSWAYDAATGLITWHLTGTGQDEGDLSGQVGTLEFVVRMPDLPRISPLAGPGVAFAGLMWNQASLTWTQADDTEGSDPHTSSSNAVTDAANEVLPPRVTPPEVLPPSLPNTGGPGAWPLAAGLLSALAGAALVATSRRRRRS
jgi:LPXTG-motif cell wall-anchored protein